MANVGIQPQNQPRDWDDLRRALRDQGWSLTETQDHFAAKPPDGGPIVHFSDSRDSRAILNALSHLRKSGFIWPPPQKPKTLPARNEKCPRCLSWSWDPTSGQCLRGRCPSNEDVVKPALRVDATPIAPVIDIKPLPPVAEQEKDALDCLMEDVRAAKEMLASDRTLAQDAAGVLAKAQSDFEQAKRNCEASQKTFDEAKAKLVAALDA